MSTTNATPGEQPGQDSQTVPDGAQPQDLASQLESQTAEQLLELITGQAPEGPPSAPIPAAPIPDGEQPPDSTPPDEVPPEAGSTEIKPPPGRASHRFLPEEEQREHLQALDLVREKKAKDLPDAYRQLRGELEPIAAPPVEGGEPAPAVVPTPPEPATAEPLQVIQNRLTDLREQRKQAKRDFDPDEEDRLTTEIEDTLVALQEAKTNAAQRQQVQVAYEQQYQTALDELDKLYPDAQDDTSDFSELLDAMVIKARVDKDPILNDPRYVLTLAERLAAKLAPKPTGTPPTGPTTRAQRPTGASVAPGHSQAPRLNPDQTKAFIDSQSPEDLLAAIVADDQGGRR